MFVDLTKEFDLVDQEFLHTVLLKSGCPPVFLALIRLFHNSMHATVHFGGQILKHFSNCGRSEYEMPLNVSS